VDADAAAADANRAAAEARAQADADAAAAADANCAAAEARAAAAEARAADQAASADVAHMDVDKKPAAIKRRQGEGMDEPSAKICAVMYDAASSVPSSDVAPSSNMSSLA